MILRQKCISKPGEVGDCWRVCIAMILNMDARLVPHFGQMHEDRVQAGFEGADTLMDLTEQWLAKWNLGLSSCVYPPELSMEEVLDSSFLHNQGVPFILNGAASRENHSIVCYDGKTFNPGNAPITGPINSADRGWWVVTIAVAAGFKLGEVK